MKTSPVVSCIIRHHNPQRELELKRCLFSLAGQTIENIEAVIVLQRFSDEEIKRVEKSVEPLLKWRTNFHCKIINFQDGAVGDARTHLLNIGIRHASGSYVGFLDYDDVLYPEAYALLLNRLIDDNAQIAFASIRVIKCNLHDDYIYSTGAKTDVFPGETLPELFAGNFCPLHSYLIAKGAISKWDIQLDPALSWEEDYDFLLQIVSKVRSSFSLIGTIIGDYYIKNDASNTIGISGVEGTMSAEKRAAYLKVKARIELRRQITTLSKEVLTQLNGPQSESALTIRDYLDLDNTHGMIIHPNDRQFHGNISHYTRCGEQIATLIQALFEEYTIGSIVELAPAYGRVSRRLSSEIQKITTCIVKHKEQGEFLSNTLGMKCIYADSIYTYNRETYDLVFAMHATCKSDSKELSEALKGSMQFCKPGGLILFTHRFSADASISEFYAVVADLCGLDILSVKPKYWDNAIDVVIANVLPL